MALAQNVAMLLSGRFLLGTGFGMMIPGELTH